MSSQHVLSFISRLRNTGCMFLTALAKLEHKKNSLKVFLLYPFFFVCLFLLSQCRFLKLFLSLSYGKQVGWGRVRVSVWMKLLENHAYPSQVKYIT